MGWSGYLISFLNVNVSDAMERKRMENIIKIGDESNVFYLPDKPRLEIFIGSVLQQHGINCL